MHVAMCPRSQDIVMSYLGENSEAACEVVSKMAKHLLRSVTTGCSRSPEKVGKKVEISSGRNE